MEILIKQEGDLRVGFRNGLILAIAGFWLPLITIITLLHAILT